jgi:hypothetical protein
MNFLKRLFKQKIYCSDCRYCQNKNDVFICLAPSVSTFVRSYYDSLREGTTKCSEKNKNNNCDDHQHYFTD